MNVVKIPSLTVATRRSLAVAGQADGWCGMEKNDDSSGFGSLVLGDVANPQGVKE